MYKRQVTARANAQAQLSFFQLDDPVLCQVRDEILGIDVNNLTPLEALNKLSEIKKIVDPRWEFFLNEEWRMKNEEWELVLFSWVWLYEKPQAEERNPNSSFFILHSSFNNRVSAFFTFHSSLFTKEV